MKLSQKIHTLVSTFWIKKRNAGNSSLIVLALGGGSLFRHRLTITHVTLRKNVIGTSDRKNFKRGATTPSSIQWSLNNGPSPIIFPRAQTACSQTLLCDELSNFKNLGTALAWTTAFVCSDVPDAILVRAHAASNWILGNLRYYYHKHI